jgi:hypothetical protein
MRNAQVDACTVKRAHGTRNPRHLLIEWRTAHRAHGNATRTRRVPVRRSCATTVSRPDDLNAVAPSQTRSTGRRSPASRLGPAARRGSSHRGGATALRSSPSFAKVYIGWLVPRRSDGREHATSPGCGSACGCWLCHTTCCRCRCRETRPGLGYRPRSLRSRRPWQCCQP